MLFERFLEGIAPTGHRTLRVDAIRKETLQISFHDLIVRVCFHLRTYCLQRAKSGYLRTFANFWGDSIFCSRLKFGSLGVAGRLKISDIECDGFKNSV